MTVAERIQLDALKVQAMHLEDGLRSFQQRQFASCPIAIGLSIRHVQRLIELLTKEIEYEPKPD